MDVPDWYTWGIRVRTACIPIGPPWCQRGVRGQKIDFFTLAQNCSGIVKMAQKRPETVNIWFLAHIVLLTGTRAVTLGPARIVKIVIWAYFLRLWELSVAFT